VRTAGALRKAGYKSRRRLRADIETGALHPYISIHDYGRYADSEVRKWLGLKSWTECGAKATINRSQSSFAATPPASLE
jgi:hypothetical protein